MSCIHENSDKTRCPYPQRTSKDICIFHDPDLASKTGREVSQQMAQIIAAAKPGESLLFEHAVLPDLDLSGLKISVPVSFNYSKFFGDFAWFEKVEFGAVAKFALCEFRCAVASFKSARFHAVAVFGKTTFDCFETNFSMATFQDGGSLAFTTFTDRVVMSHARMKGMVLYKANFRLPAMTESANFEDADLRDAYPMVLDDAFIRGARFSDRAADPWSKLRRKYTGTMFTLHLVLMALFLAPYVLRTVKLVVQNRVQTELQSLAVQTTEMLAELPANRSPELETTAKAIAASINTIKPCLARSCREFAVYEVLLGWDGSVWWAILVGLLMTYNLFRGILTYHVSLMREAEERSGFSPRWQPQKAPVEPSRRDRWRHATWIVAWLVWVARGGPPRWEDARWSYGWLTGVHYGMSLLFLVAFSTLVWHMVDWLSRPVFLR